MKIAIKKLIAWKYNISKTETDIYHKTEGQEKKGIMQVAHYIY